VSYYDGKAEEVKPVEKPAAPKPEKKVEPASAPKAVPNVRARGFAEERTPRKRQAAYRTRRTVPRAKTAARTALPAPSARSVPPRSPSPLSTSAKSASTRESEQIRAFLKGLLEHMDSAAEVKVYESEKGRYKVFLEGEKLGALIGRRGETLDAIQQLTNYSINRGSEKNRARVQVDAEKLPRKSASRASSAWRKRSPAR